MKQFNKQAAAKEFIERCLKDGEKPAGLLIKSAAEAGISVSSMKKVAHKIVYTEKRADAWYWRLINPPVASNNTSIVKIKSPKINGGFFDGLDDD